MITFNPDGGDLGRAFIKGITALELQLVVPHIASILNELEAASISELPFKYAFEFPVQERDNVFLVMNAIKLPLYVQWYSVDGRRTFEMRGNSGGVVTSYICYLVTKK